MKFKRTMAAVLSAALICAGGTATAMATGNAQDAPVSPVIPEQTVYPYSVGVEATIVEIMEKDANNTTNSVLIKTTAQTPEEIVLHLSDETILMDSQAGTPVAFSDLKVGEKIQAYHDMAMTRSLPPQTHAQAILVNLPKQGNAAHFLTAEKVTVNVDGSVTILAESGTIYVTIGKDTPIAPLMTKNIVKNTDIHMGTRIVAWYDVVALSMPGQAQATKAVILPNVDKEAVTIVADDIALGEGKVVDGVTMVPIRVVGEKLGFTVTWDGKNDSVVLDNGTVKTSVKIGQDMYYKAAAKEGMVGMSAPTSLGAAAYTEKGISWAPAELFNLLLGAPAVTLEGDVIRL